ncbi:MAG: MopE-related protein, partial [Myxococcota bacterium]|nr:MopE-related protein [Myxococcota bacterium]
VLASCPGPAAAVEVLDGRAFYFGELHAHTGLSADGGSSDLGNCDPGGCGDLVDYFSNARDLAGLDFAAITDHINGNFAIDGADWPQIVDLVDAGHAPQDGFVALLGAEVQLGLDDGTDLGHRNYLFFGDPQQVGSLAMDQLAGIAGQPSCEDMWSAVAAIEDAAGPLLLLPHHPASSIPMPTRWWCQDERLAPLVEVYSGHGNSRDFPDRDDYDPLFFPYTGGSTINEALAVGLWGLHLGLIGGTDFHDTWPGMVCHTDLMLEDQAYGGSLTGVVLDEGRAFDRESLYDALLHRHAFATTGPQVPVLLTALDEAGDEIGVAGDILSPPPEGPVSLRITFPASLAPHVLDVQLYDSSQQPTPVPQVSPGVHELALEGWEVPWFGYAIVQIDGGSWYASQGVICEDGGVDDQERVWTSPIWFEELDDHDGDGDGFSELDGDCDDMLASIHPGAAEQANGVDDDCDGDVDEGLELPEGIDWLDDDVTTDDDDSADDDGGGSSPGDDDCDCRLAGEAAPPLVSRIGLLVLIAAVARRLRRRTP